MEKNSLLRPLWGLGATYAVRLRLIGKLIGDFLLVIIERFSLGAFVLSQSTRLSGGQTDRQKVNHNTVCMLRSRTVKTTHCPNCALEVLRKRTLQINILLTYLLYLPHIRVRMILVRSLPHVVKSDLQI